MQSKTPPLELEEATHNRAALRLRLQARKSRAVHNLRLLVSQQMEVSRVPAKDHSRLASQQPQDSRVQAGKLLLLKAPVNQAAAKAIKELDSSAMVVVEIVTASGRAVDANAKVAFSDPSGDPTSR